MQINNKPSLNCHPSIPQLTLLRLPSRPLPRHYCAATAVYNTAPTFQASTYHNKETLLLPPGSYFHTYPYFKTHNIQPSLFVCCGGDYSTARRWFQPAPRCVSSAPLVTLDGTNATILSHSSGWPQARSVKQLNDPQLVPDPAGQLMVHTSRKPSYGRKAQSGPLVDAGS